MMHLRSCLLSAFTILFISTAYGQEPIRFARTPDISPDGRQVVFSYLGDIWIVETIGGIARPITMHEAHDIYPIFSPDGRRIAFSSNRHGSYDVFVVPVEGGRPKRLTFDSSADLASGWSPDGKEILFTSTRNTAFPLNLELYAVAADGAESRVRRLGVPDSKDGVVSPKGDQIAYVRGPGNWFRKGYRGSSNDDIWICNRDGSNSRRFTNFNGQDTSPMFSPDGQTLYYVSECFGTPANIVRQSLAAGSKPQALTNHHEDSVRRARLSGNGEYIVYECGPDLWVASTQTGSTRKLAIEVHADDKVNTEHTRTFTQGATEFALSNDERHVAFVVHGELFMMPIAGGKATRLTDNLANDHGIAWSPDARKIIFASDRNGFEDLYLLEPDDPENKDLVKAHIFKVKQLTNTPDAETGTSFSPDGRRVGFIRSGKLWTMNPDGSDQKVIVNDPQVFDYDWSPDSRFLVYARRDGQFASDLFIIPAAGGPTAVAKNITRFATYNGGVSWSVRGKKIAFISERHRNEPSLFVLSLQKPGIPGAWPSSDIDWEDIHLRVEQPAPLPIDEGAISPDGNKVAFRAVGPTGADLWIANSNGSQLTRLTTGNQRPRQITWSRHSSDVVYYLDNSGSIHSARAGLSFSSELFRLGASSSDSGRINFSAKMTIRRDELFNEMFAQSWRALSEEFYDPAFHGTNWDAVRKKYEPLVQHVAMREDFYSLVNLMLGELNASHLGILGFSAPPEELTADLGLLFDESYAGPGLKIQEILKRGPADRRGLNLKAGEIITAIDNTELKARTNISKLLNGKIGEVVTLHVTTDPANAKSRRRVEIQATSPHATRDLMYERWIAANARRVSELSHGKLGYIHIPSMDEEGLEKFVRGLYSENYDKDAIVLDVRYNEGGFTHDQVLNYLGGREHTYFRQRHGGQGGVMRSFDRKWTKPLVLLINNRSYSDAEIFPSAFRTLGLGKLVGQATAGHVIGTSVVQLIDGSLLQIPRVGVFTTTGADMEREGVMPDVAVDPYADQLVQGADAQLDRAVDVLQKDVVAWKKAHVSVALGGGESRNAVASPAPAAKK